VENAGRSRLAEAWLRRLADPAKARALSAGSRPAAHVHREVEAVLQEHGLSAGDAPPRLLTPELAADATVLITMGCGESCPAVPGVERIDWDLSDPKGRSIEDVRALSGEVRARVEALVADRGWA
jgi:arsenate reductase